jgi:hypothetical protein
MQMSVVVGCFEIVNTVDYLGIFWIFACSPKRPFSNIFSMFFDVFAMFLYHKLQKKIGLKKKKKKCGFLFWIFMQMSVVVGCFEDSKYCGLFGNILDFCLQS